MSRCRVLLLSAFAALSLSNASFAQTTPQIPACFAGLDQGTVGVPYFCDFGTALNQYLTPFFQDTGVSITFTFGTTAGTTLPPGLGMTPAGVLSGTPTAAGLFTFSIDIAYNISFSGQAFQETVPYPTSLQVNGSGSGATIVDPRQLVFSLTQGAPASTQSLSLTSRNAKAINYTASASTTTGTGWLSVSPGGTVNPFQSSAATVTVTAGQLVAGTYSGTVALVLDSGENFKVPVLLTVTGSQQSLVLSQTGLSFQAVQGGAATPPQPISVLNGGTGSLNFTTAASTLGGGPWLTVSPASGTASASVAGTAAVSVNIAGLSPGTYYGQVKFSATGVPNSPQTITVVLTVFTPDNTPGPILSETGVILVQSGATTSNARPLTVTNPSPNPLRYVLTPNSDTSTNFFTVTPTSGTVTLGQPASIGIQPVAGLKSGVYTGSLAILCEDTSTQAVCQARVAVVLIVLPAAASSSRGGFIPLAACGPTKLIPVATQLGNSFKAPAAWPTPLEITVVDDCGNFMTQGNVIVTFSTGDPPLTLSSLQDGRWTGTWVPRATSATQVTLTAQAQQLQPALKGSLQFGGTVQPNTTVPSIDAGGVVSAASNSAGQPMAPGGYISIYGNNLSTASFSASSLPLQTQLGATQVILAGKQLPLNFAGTGQINAVVPFDTPINTTQQLIVQQGTQLSAPEPVVLSAAQPAIFTQDQSGQGFGVIVGYKANGSGSFLVDANHPVSAGDTLVIYCTGLGSVDQSAVAGNAGPSSPLANATNTVTATIGGQSATVAFAGLAPQLTVYQVNLIVPTGVTPGTSVPLILTQAGRQSVPVTIAVQ
jgi:uncharacterized protein (TIGR03437 family)